MAFNPNQAAFDSGQVGLGLGMGFDPRQRRQFESAVNSGGLSAWEAAHPNQARRFENRVGGKGGSAQNQAAAQGYKQKNSGVGNSAGGVKATPPPAANAGMSTSAPPPAAPTGTNTTGGNKGTGGTTPPAGQASGPFQMQSWYGGNPLVTAQNLANQNLQTQLGGIRAQFGGMGLGNSSRNALAQGTAAAQSATGLGDVLAQRGLGAYQSDADRTIAANQQLANLGTGLTGIGSSEQSPPLASILMNLLSGLSGQDLISSFMQSGGGGYWR